MIQLRTQRDLKLNAALRTLQMLFNLDTEAQRTVTKIPSGLDSDSLLER